MVAIGGDRDGLRRARPRRSTPTTTRAKGPSVASSPPSARLGAPSDIVVVLACDMPAIDAATVVAVVDALARPTRRRRGRAAGSTGGVQILTAAYRTRLATAAGRRRSRRGSGRPGGRSRAS